MSNTKFYSLSNLTKLYINTLRENFIPLLRTIAFIRSLALIYINVSYEKLYYTLYWKKYSTVFAENNKTDIFFLSINRAKISVLKSLLY